MSQIILCILRGFERVEDVKELDIPANIVSRFILKIIIRKQGLALKYDPILKKS